MVMDNVASIMFNFLQSIISQFILFYIILFQISIFASFWLVNDSGIPLIFKQEGNSQEMAGQFDEHEMARSLTPLLFSFSDGDGPFR